MQTFNGMDYLRIDIANCYGLDKRNWNTRLMWAYANEDSLEALVEDADDKYMMCKAVLAYRQAQKGNPIGHNMFLDATASGLQIMACLSGCLETAKRCNLVNTGSRECAYDYVEKEMNMLLEPEEQVTRSLIKKPTMTHYYSKQDHEELTDVQKVAFYEVLGKSFEGAEQVKDLIQSYWNPYALEHSWSMPDGHKVIAKVVETLETRVEVDELGVSFKYVYEDNVSSFKSTSLCPNIIHSIDGYITREMVRRCNSKGVQLAHVHDAFCASPQYMNIVRQTYIDILCDIADSNMLADILSEISGQKIIIDKTINNLSDYIKESEYALS